MIIHNVLFSLTIHFLVLGGGSGVIGVGVVGTAVVVGTGVEVVVDLVVVGRVVVVDEVVVDEVVVVVRVVVDVELFSVCSSFGGTKCISICLFDSG